MKPVISNNINFSIILCCYNSEKYLQETLLSIVDQTYKNFELIIVDDGSTDNTNKIINEFMLSFNDYKIKYYYKKNSGLASSRNYGLKRCKFDWVAIIDHDDLWIRDKLKIQSKEIVTNIHKKLFFTDYEILSNKNKISRFDVFYKKDKFYTPSLDLNKKNGYINLLIHGCFIGSSTVVFNKSIISEKIFFKTEYKFLTDYIFFLEVSKNYDLHCTNKILSIWRSHNLQATKKLSNIYYQEMFKLFYNIIFYKKFYYKYKLIIIKKYLRLKVSYYFNKIFNNER